MASNSKKLVFDIETIGEDFNELDKTTQDVLTRWIEKESSNETEYHLRLDDLKNGLGFSPLTGQVVAIGVLDVEKMKGGVYYQAPGQKPKRFDEDGITFESMNEKDMMRKFWDVSREYDVFITFNGRQFDVPFLVTRSAIHDVKPTKDLMRGRYLYQQHADAIHIDLQDQLSFYGAMRRKGSLHLWTRAFGIVSPKVGGVTGDDVTDLFKRKKYLDIARYNVRDIVATKELYDKWEAYFNTQ